MTSDCQVRSLVQKSLVGGLMSGARQRHNISIVNSLWTLANFCAKIDHDLLDHMYTLLPSSIICSFVVTNIGW